MNSHLTCAALLIAATLLAAADPAPMPRLPFDADRARPLQQEWGKAFNLDAELTNSVGMELR